MIERKRIKNINSYLIGIHDDDNFYVAKKVSEINSDLLNFIGFSIPVNSGEQVLPRPLGAISRFNANGSFIKRKDLPKETKYREVCIKDWHDSYHYVDVPYKRYQREIIPAPAIELKIVSALDNLYVISPLLHKDEPFYSDIKHVINLYLELFGSCELLTENLTPTISSVPITRVNWRILPEGEYPWTRLAQLAGDLSSNRIGKAKVQEHNISTILQYRPSELVYGAGGFRGYLVFKFPAKNLFILENVIYGNATYVFENEWEEFSHLTKAEIIQNRLVRERIEHRAGWEAEINRLLS